jgi:hypothetical protein
LGAEKEIGQEIGENFRKRIKQFTAESAENAEINIKLKLKSEKSAPKSRK